MIEWFWDQYNHHEKGCCWSLKEMVNVKIHPYISSTRERITDIEADAYEALGYSVSMAVADFLDDKHEHEHEHEHE